MANNTFGQHPQMDGRIAERLKQKKKLLDSHRPLSRDTVLQLNNDLRIFLTYHSNAIEGNTLSLRETQMVIEYGVTVDGHPLREYLEATNHAEAYQHMTVLIERHESITIETILTLHRVVTDKILEGNGQFRTVPVYIRGAATTPPAPKDVEMYVRQWVNWVNKEGLTHEPIMRATIAHHGFESVHPFVDGNGRVGRLLLNIMLMNEGYPPALLLRDWRVRYIRALATADTGDYAPLANLIGQAVEEGLDLYLEACAKTPEYHPLTTLDGTGGYRLEYLSWLARQGRIEAVKRGRLWYSTKAAIEQYKAEVDEGKIKRGRPKNNS